MFLDAIRAIAILRVIAWHAFGVAAITYVIAAMPAMFFVSGSLLAKSLGHRSARAVLTDRFRRLLVPLWVFGLVAWAVMALAAWQGGTGLPLERALAWILPFTDPRGTEWEGGWLSSHLWYLRTFVWLLLASPLLLRAVRRRRNLTFGVAIVAVFALDLLSRGRRGSPLPFGDGATWAIGDVVLYSVFFMAGFLHRDGAFRRIRSRGWLLIAVVAGAAAVLWRLTQPVPLGVVNNSHPLHLFVGAAWLAVAMAAQRPLARLATGPVTGVAVRAIGRRSLTIYLWHTAAIILAVNILEARHVDDALAYNVGLVLLTALGIILAVWLFGWVEDFAAGRRTAPAPAAAPTTAAPTTTAPTTTAHHSAAAPVPAPAPISHPVPRRLALGTLVAMTLAILLTSSGTPATTSDAAATPRSSRRPPVPSKPPPAPTFTETRPHVAEPQPLTQEEEDKFVARLDGLLRDWAAEHRVNGALVGVAVGPDIRWTGATGTRPENGQVVTPKDTIDLASLTKLFTAALVHRQADAGRLDVYEPLRPLTALPDFPYDEGITVEELLDHTSGLVNYRDTTKYLNDPQSIADPITAIMASVAEPRLAPPGWEHNYSSTNYLLLGLLLEDVTGRPFDVLLNESFIAPLGLRETNHRPPSPGEPRGATAGIHTTLPDLLKAGVAILRDHSELSDESYQRMTTIDPQSGYGPGTYGFCPCRLDENGEPHFFAIGYFGATTLLAYLPSLDITFAIDLVDSLWEEDLYAPVTTLFEMIEELVQNS